MAIPDPAAPAKTLGLQNISFSSNVMFSFRLRKGFRKYDWIPVVFSINISKYLMKPAAPQTKTSVWREKFKSFLTIYKKYARKLLQF